MLKVGRYALGDRIAAGGMATVHLGRLLGSAGFSRTVAIKRLHPHLCEDPSFTASFADEARLVARIRHPNVVPTLDVVSTEGELLIVMEFIDGESLSALLRRSEDKRVPLPIVVAILSEMLHGLHSAHEAKSESGKPLDIVHRDVSPQNVLVGSDGVARLVDFGIARTRAKSRQSATGENDLKGKLSYMAPEQIRREDVTRRTDIFAAGIVLWELLTGKRLFASDSEAATMEKILVGWVQPPSTHVPDLPPALDDIALRALDAEPNNRFQTAFDMAVALEEALQRALGREVGAWVEAIAADTLAPRRQLVARAEGEGATRSTSVSLTSEVPTTPRRGEFTKPSGAPPPLVTVIEGAPEPRTGPSLPLPAELVLENERTMISWGEPATQAPLIVAEAPAPPPRSRMDRAAYTVLALATLVALVVGLSWSKIAPPPAPVRPLAQPFVETPPTGPVEAPSAEPTPSPPPGTATAVAPVPPPPVVRRPPLVVRPRSSAPAKSPCVSKVDPASGKKIYQGDCD